MDRVHIPRSEDLAPGSWAMGALGEVVHRCPKCRKASEMLNHSVEPNGEVNASIACFPPCDYHVWGILDGWSNGKKEAGRPAVV
jgi:hypothetical protein